MNNPVQLIGTVLGEVALIESEIQNGQPAETPGVEVPIAGKKGKLSLKWTPDPT